MSNYWIIAPIESYPSDVFDATWEFDLTKNVISIGWVELADVSQLSRDELRARVSATYPEKRSSTVGLVTNMIWNFYHEIKPGDIILARRGMKILAAVGRVLKAAVYSPSHNPNCNHPNCLEVDWQQTPRDIAFPTVVFPMITVSKSSEDEYLKIVGTQLAPGDIASETKTSDQYRFILEKYLEEFIVSNFDAVFHSAMRIYVNEENINGQQYDTQVVGRIDILAVERETNAFIVIELKKGNSSDYVLGQTLRYMGWVKKTLCDQGQEVKGLIICNESDEKLSYALEMTTNIQVKYYKVSFQLEDHRG